MDISTFDKEVKDALGKLPEEHVQAVKAVVSAAQNFDDSYFVDITWNDGLNEFTTQLKFERTCAVEEIFNKIKGAYDCAVIKYMM